jgi:2-dehydropantoate 2-reductase
MPGVLQDLRTGRRLELESLNGAVVRLGQEVGVPTPLNFAVYAESVSNWGQDFR